MFVPTYNFTLTEHDPERPWIVRGQTDKRSRWTTRELLRVGTRELAGAAVERRT
jgi:hypothetical protein